MPDGTGTARSAGRARAFAGATAALPGGEFLRYFLVCAFALAVDFSLLAFLTEVVDLHYLLANVIAFTTGVVITYVACVRWVFRTRRLARRDVEFTAFAVIGVIGVGVNSGGLWVLTELAGIHYLASKIGAAGASFLCGYLLRRFLLFR